MPASKFDGASLNDTELKLLTGPDLLNNLVGISQQKDRRHSGRRTNVSWSVIEEDS